MTALMNKEFYNLVNSMDISELEEFYNKINSLDASISKRLLFLMMIHKNPRIKFSEIASELDVDRRTLTRWKNKFVIGGFKKLVGVEYVEVKNLSLDSIGKINNWIDSHTLLNKSDEYLEDFLNENIQDQFDTSLITKVIKISSGNHQSTSSESKKVDSKQVPKEEKKDNRSNYIKEMIHSEAKKFLKQLKSKGY